MLSIETKERLSCAHESLTSPSDAYNIIPKAPVLRPVSCSPGFIPFFELPPCAIQFNETIVISKGVLNLIEQEHYTRT